MFNFSEYLKKGFLGAIGNKPSYQIILDSAGWHKAGFLSEEDLAEIDSAIKCEEVAKESEADDYEDLR